MYKFSLRKCLDTLRSLTQKMFYYAIVYSLKVVSQCIVMCEGYKNENVCMIEKVTELSENPEKFYTYQPW